MTVRILALCGSLQARSSNAQLLRAAGRVAPPGCRVDPWSGLGRLPHYCPDLDHLDRDRLPASVRDWRTAVQRADGLLICCPEYARGVPGAFKNSLDWLVGGDEAYAKPVASWNASPRSRHAQQALELIVGTLAMRWHSGASIALPVRGRGLDAAGIASDPELASVMRAALASFVAEIRRARDAGVTEERTPAESSR